MKMIVGPTIKWYITGQFEWKKIRVATGFANVRMYDGLYFHKLELYVEVSWCSVKFLVEASSTVRKMTGLIPQLRQERIKSKRLGEMLQIGVISVIIFVRLFLDMEPSHSMDHACHHARYVNVSRENQNVCKTAKARLTT